MSASNTDLDKQAKNHSGPLIGIAFAVTWAAVLFIGFIAWTAYQADNPGSQSPAAYFSE
ncbi:hypothetical protein [Algirhabdus cladophorae]|uniref:hypothetical protein n=1 Tax=Algirhabdus cladophorae TaxID=3377108 RepID=UPI003B847CC6